MAGSELVKKMEDAIKKVPGEKIPYEVWAGAKKNLADGDAAFEKGEYKKAIEAWNKEGIDKNVEKGMEHIPFSPETLAAIKDVLRTKVVPDWVKRAGGAEAARNFNEVIAPLVGFTVNP